MFTSFRFRHVRGILPKNRRANWWPTILITILPLIFPLAAYAQVGASPFDTGFTALQTLFTGTVARVASLIAIVIGGYRTRTANNDGAVLARGHKTVCGT